MTGFGSLLYLYTCIMCIGIVSGQLTMYGCPSGWEKNKDSCYKFVSDKPTIYEVADAACWLFGATLVNVNTFEEHSFLSAKLTTLHAARPWFTSGIYSGNTLTWRGDNSVDTGLSVWITAPAADSVYSTVAYALGKSNSGHDFGWKLVSPSTPSSYVCEIPQKEAINIGKMQRDIGYGQGDIDPHMIPRGPDMMSEPESVLVFGETPSVYLECASTGNPAPVFRWSRGNATITSSTNDRYTVSGGRLTIEYPQEKQDGGYYHCEIENEYGVILSHQAQLLFGYLHEFPPVPPQDFWGTAFEGTRVLCDAPSYNPVVKYQWFKFHTNNWVWPGHPIHFVSMSGYLYFSEVQPTDGRQYFCVVTLAAPDNYRVANAQPPSRTSYGRYLRIKGGKTTGNYGPILYTHAFPSPALRGLTVRLECIAYGSSPLKYTWYREDRRPFEKGTKLSARNRVLTIPNAQLEANGNYVCKCSRPGRVVTKVITLVMEARPYFPFAMKDKLADPKQTITWRCKAVARPAPTYTWFKNGQPVTTIPGQIEVRGTYLKIFGVDKERDEGMYQCAATNDYGTSYTSGQLKVLSFKPTFNKSPLPETTLAPLGGNISIPCHVEGAPLPVVSWLRGGGDLNLVAGSLDSRVGMSLGNDLVIHTLTYADQGVYTCKATNDNGEAETHTRLQVVQGIVITRAPSSVTARVNTTTFLYCQAAYDMLSDIAYDWIFNGHPIDFTYSRHYAAGSQEAMNGLYILNTQYSHQGTYACEARTAFHTEVKSAYVKVLGPPGRVAGVYVDHTTITSQSARVIWTVGVETDHGDPIMSYDVEGETHYHPGIWKVLAANIAPDAVLNEAVTMGLRPDQRTTVVQNLLPNSGYRFRVRAVNHVGRGQDASDPSETIQIPSTAPVLAPRGVTGGFGKVGTLTIIWEKLDISEYCGNGFGYKVYWKKNGERRQGWSRNIVGGEKDKAVVTVGADNYYLLYDVMVGAFNDKGDGPNSTIEVIYSAEGIPIAVPTITSISSLNSTAVQVYWTPVKDDRENMKGRVKGYTIQHYTNVDGIQPYQGYEPDRLINFEVYGQTNTATIIGLEKNSEFFFRMQSRNTAARGPKGEWRRTETYMTAPLHWPRNIRIHSHGEHSIRVTWQGISTSQYEESILGYKLRVWKVQEDVRTANDTVVGKVMEAVVYGLQSKTVYVLRLLGYSMGGDGAQSLPFFFTVLGGQLPFDPTTSQICFEGSSLCSAAEAFLPAPYVLVVSLLLAVFLRTGLPWRPS